MVFKSNKYHRIESSMKSLWPRQVWFQEPKSWLGRQRLLRLHWSSPRWTPRRSWWWRGGICPGSRRNNHVWKPASTTEFQRIQVVSEFLKYVCWIIDDIWAIFPGLPINLRCFTRILVVKGASLGSASNACFCFSSNFWPSRKYFLINVDTFEITIEHIGCFILYVSKYKST